MNPETGRDGTGRGQRPLSRRRPLPSCAPGRGSGGLPGCVPTASGCRPCGTPGSRSGARGCSCGRWACGRCWLLGDSVIHNAFDPPGLTSGFGPLGNLLAAPAARWDGAWYLWIAHYGYEPAMGAATAQRAAFFPLYPLALRGVSELGIPAILAGVLVSVAALGLALYGIHRLATLELRGRGVARTAVLVMAFAPMAFFFSAVYSESLYLALSVGVFWAARHGRWWLVGVLGALAGATRSAGIVLLVPALILYVYGPREDRAPDFLRRRRGWAEPGAERDRGPRARPARARKAALPGPLEPGVAGA